MHDVLSKEGGFDLPYTVFHLYDTLGFPMELMHEMLEEEGFRINYYKFSLEAAQHGWSTKKIRSLIENVTQGRIKFV